MAKRNIENLWRNDILKISKKIVKKLDFTEEKIAKLSIEFTDLIFQTCGINEEIIPVSVLRNYMKKGTPQYEVLKLLCITSNLEVL